ncbi:MAG: hypothetical protein Q8P93_00120 [bacterium]|nr:hypothetical protein [bacterium]
MDWIRQNWFGIALAVGVVSLLIYISPLHDSALKEAGLQAQITGVGECASSVPKNPYPEGTDEHTGFEWSELDRQSRHCEAWNGPFIVGCMEHVRQASLHARCLGDETEAKKLDLVEPILMSECDEDKQIAGYCFSDFYVEEVSAEKKQKILDLEKLLPRFEDYPVVASSIPPRPFVDRSSHPDAWEYRTLLGSIVDEATSYEMAGHFLMSDYGTGNPRVFIVNGLTGQVFHEIASAASSIRSFATSSLVIFDPIVPECFTAEGDYYPRDIEVCPESDGRTRNPQYVVWDGDHFNILCNAIIRAWNVVSCGEGSQKISLDTALMYGGEEDVSVAVKEVFIDRNDALVATIEDRDMAEYIANVILEKCPFYEPNGANYRGCLFDLLEERQGRYVGTASNYQRILEECYDFAGNYDALEYGEMSMSCLIYKLADK